MPHREVCARDKPSRTKHNGYHLEGVDKINNEVVAGYPDVEEACHGNQTLTRQH